MHHDYTVITKIAQAVINIFQSLFKTMIAIYKHNINPAFGQNLT